MQWLTVITWLQSQGTLTILVTAGIIAFLVIKGIVRIPGIQNKINKKKGGNPHAECVNVDDVMLRFDTVLETSMEISKILNYDRVREQMNVAEVVVEDILDLMRKHYLKLLHIEKGKKDGLVASSEYKCYDNLLRGLNAFVLNKIRYILRENHVPKNDAEFSVWLESKTKNLIQEVNGYLNGFYLSSTISREKLYDSHMGKAPEIDGIITTITIKINNGFRTIKQIGEEKLHEVTVLENKIRAILPKER